MRYRRAYHPGATWFFTVVTADRQKIFDNPDAVELLRESIRHVKQHHPFELNAAVILPDHLHAIWTLPDGDADFSIRWMLIKSGFTRNYRQMRMPSDFATAHSDLRDTDKNDVGRSERSEVRQNALPIWQNRFWEHLIRDEADYRAHVEYIHYNPVKHGYVEAPRDWPYSSFHRFMAGEDYPADWGSDVVPVIPEGVGNE